MRKNKSLNIRLNLVRVTEFRIDDHCKFPIAYTSEIYLNNKVIGQTLTPCTFDDFINQLIKEIEEDFTI